MKTTKIQIVNLPFKQPVEIEVINLYNNSAVIKTKRGFHFHISRPKSWTKVEVGSRYMVAKVLYSGGKYARLDILDSTNTIYSAMAIPNEMLEFGSVKEFIALHNKVSGLVKEFRMTAYE